MDSNDKQDRSSSYYNCGDLGYIILSLATQLETSLKKVAIKYIEPLVVYKITDPHNYLN